MQPLFSFKSYKKKGKIQKRNRNTMKQTLSLITLLLLLSAHLYAEKYYWVGGTGNWSELEHWSPISGGIDIHHGVIPTYNDSVYFDENSFSESGQIVTIDVEHAICMRMDWTNAQFTPTLTSSGGNNLSVYGSFLLNAAMNFTFTGKIYFESSSGEREVKTFGKNLNSNIYFNGTAGNWQVDELLTTGDVNQNGLDSRLAFDGNLQTTKFIFINSGVFICESKTITADRFISASGFAKELFVEATHFELGSRWQVENSNIILHNTNSIIRLLAASPSFYAGENNDYTKVIFNSEYGEARYIGNNCSIDSTLCNASMRISGNENLFEFMSIALNANFEGNNSFGKLWLSPNRNYKFESEKTQTILTELIASGECSGFSHLYSSSSAQAIISKASGNVTLTNVLIENIEATGGAVFTANQSAGLKENPGWTINENPRTLYWVGGSGDWNDTEHWSLTSGGVGGECLPFHFDDVVFNDNSFLTTRDLVKLNTPKVYCNNMTWETTSGEHIFSSFTERLRIYGSLQLSEYMTFILYGETYFLSKEAGNTVKTSGKIFLNKVSFAELGGEWTLLDSLNCGSSDLELQKGSLNTADYNVFCKSFLSSNSNERALNLGSSIVTISENWKTANSENFLFDSGTSLIKMTFSTADLYGGSDLEYHNVIFTEAVGKGTLESTDCNYNKVVFSGNGNLLGTNLYDTLELTAAKVYAFDFAGVQTINTLIGEGSCSGYILLNSSQSGTPAKIAKEQGSILMDYLVLKDIDASQVVDGFFANSSIDMGNNIACTITSPLGTDLFWVGGNGYWADEANWSYESGGAGGACVPSPADNVYFDGNSFSVANQSVYIDMEKAFCNNMDWTGSQYLPAIRNVGTSTLTVYASFTLVEGMNWDYGGNVIFDSKTELNEITSAGNSFKKNVYFQDGGIWNLKDSFFVSQNLSLISGTLKTNNYKLKVGSFYSTTNFASVLELGNSAIEIADKWDVRSNFTLGEGDFVVSMTGARAQMNNSCIENLAFNDVFFTEEYAVLALTFISGTTETSFKNIYFSGVGELKGEGVKTADTVSFQSNGKLANTNIIKKIICNSYGQIWDNAIIDTLLLNTRGDITGENNIRHATIKDDLLITGENVFGYCKINGNGDVFGSNIFDTLIFSPDKRYEFQGGKTQKVLKEFKIRGNNCRHIYFLSSNSQKAIVYKPDGSVRGDFIEMQNIGSSGGSDFYAGSFNHSDNIDNSCQGWIFEDEPGYIYGLEQDTIITRDEIALLSTENLNADDFTSFRWSTGDETPFLEVSEAGLYTVTATYGFVNGFLCEYTDDIIVHFADMQAPLCVGDSDGKIEIFSDDSDKYDFLWQDNSTLTYVENLAQGNYSVEVVETASGRKTTRSFNLPDGFDLELSVNKANLTCNASDDGNISVDLLNGTEPFTYTWTNYGNVENDELLNLPVGEYQLEYSDAYCSKTEVISINEPNELIINFETKISCSDSDGGEVIAHAEGGSENYTFQWKAYSSLNDSILSTLSGQQYYVLTLVDENLCQTKDSVLFSQPEAFSVSVLSIENEACADDGFGLLKLNISGGSQDYTSLLNSELVSLVDNSLEVELGFHSMEISDKNNCLQKVEFEIKEAELSEININSFDEKCGSQDGRIEYNILSNREIKEINWTNSQNQSLSSLENLSADWYFVNFSDEKNCVFKDSVELFSSDCYSFIEVPNVFTPNNDGINDLFGVNAKSILIFSGTIVNRWGRQVFSWKDFAWGWNGKLNGIGNDLSSGVYYYLIKATGEDGKFFDLKGHFYLER